MDLVKINSQNEAVTSHLIISEGMRVSQHSSLELIKRYKKDLEKFGKLSFQMIPLESGQKQKQFMLNERQATLLITLMRNTPETVAFKVKLVEHFAKIQTWIKERQQSTTEYKTMSSILKGSRQLIGKETKSFHYSNEAKLVNWALFGEFKPVNKDLLSSDEIVVFNELLSMNAVLIGSGIDRVQRQESLRNMAELKHTVLP